MAWTSLLAVSALGTTLCSGAIVENAAALARLNLKFDFNRRGTAGNVVANRLSENRDNSVLVLEAGGSNADVLDIIVPFYCPDATPNTTQDWNYKTIPQAALNGRSIPYPRGFVLGGSSSVNYMIYTRGSKEDFDRMARASGDQGWSWDSLIPYMRKNERIGVPPDHHNTTGQFDPAVHGFNGINTISLAGFPNDIDSQFIQTTDELAEFPFNLDMNSGYQLGVGWLQSTIKDGSRSSSATSYLAPQFLNRPNLHVLLNARVTRILPTGADAFRTVEFVQDIKDRQRFAVTAKKEVILSAGTIGAPNILLHSGIGNSSALSSLGIKPVRNLPSVGQNLSDHILLGGPLVDNPGSQIGWLRVPENSSIFDRLPDPAAGPNTAHFELIFSAGIIGPAPLTGNYLSITSVVVSPTARGSVTLNSSDPLAPPLMDPNLLGSEVDMFIMREAIKSSLRFAAAPAWTDYIISPISYNSSSTDEELDAYIHANAGPGFHPTGTAGMSPKREKYEVVDPDLWVKGLIGLQVVDLSILPFIPAAHTQAAAYIIAERAADLIQMAWK
ncbi:aryl-alcohol-oxidase from pleurotus Eryingii [Mycena rebaudengoi]|nr:aryl-alcohol-oxidase from pleurotus Eryingii [Mycena rebaudengoi]